MYYDNMLKEEITALHFQTLENGNAVQKYVASMPDDQALGEWELHTLEDMRWNDNHQCLIKYWTQDIIKSMKWLMRKPAYTAQLSYAPHHFFDIDTPPNHLYIEMHTVDWWWDTRVRRDT